MNGLFEVEPLTERRWAQIRGQVLERVADEPRRAQLPPSPRRAPYYFGAAVGVAAAAAAVFFWRGAHEPNLRAQSARFATSDGPAVTHAGDVTIEAQAHTSLIAIQDERGAWLIVLEHGRARFLVPPRHERPAFVVDAGEVQVHVVGTRFSVERAAGRQDASVEVEQGTVRLSAHGEEELIHGGQAWPRQPVLATAAASEPHQGPVATTPAPSQGAPSTTRRHVPSVTATTPATEIAEHTASPAVAPAPTPAPPSGRQRFEQAQALEASEPDRALALYAALAARGGSWGANALYAEARLELEIGHRPRAHALLEEYLRTYPLGMNVPDARALLQRP